MKIPAIIQSIKLRYIGNEKILIIILALMMSGCGEHPPVQPSESMAASDTPVPSALPQASASSVQIVRPNPIIPPFEGVGTYKGKPDDDDVMKLLSAAYFLEMGTYGCALIDIDQEMLAKLSLNPERSYAYVTNFDNAYEVDTYMSTYISSSLYESVEAEKSPVKVFKVDGDLIWTRDSTVWEYCWGYYSFSLAGWYWYNETTLAAPFVYYDDLIYDGVFALLSLIREEGCWKVDAVIYPNCIDEDAHHFVTAEDKLEEFVKNREQNADTEW